MAACCVTMSMLVVSRVRVIGMSRAIYTRYKWVVLGLAHYTVPWAHVYLDTMLTRSCRLWAEPYASKLSIYLSCRRWQKVTSYRLHMKQAERNHVEQILSSPRTQEDIGPDGHDLGHSSQFDPVINKETRLISNLRCNMPVFVQTVPNVRLDSRFNKAID